jgi:glycosyltransferase involved in cell wall biosynthesis
MRIAVLSAQRGVVGGVETYLRWLLPELREKGHRLALGYRYEAADPALAIDRGVELDAEFVTTESGRGALERFAPDVVYAQSFHDAELEVRLTERFKVVFFAHDYYGTCATGLKRFVRPELQVCDRPFGVGCVPLNYLRGCGFVRPDRLYRGVRNGFMRQSVLRQAKTVVVASKHLRETVRAQGVPLDRVAIVPYPTLAFSPTSLEPSARELTGRVLFLGRVVENKGLDHAITACEIAGRKLGRRLTLDVGGAGPHEEHCRGLASKTRVDVHFHGWIDDQRKQQLFEGADALVVPSLWPEPFGLVGIEAACFGVPSVGYAVGGMTDWLRPGVTGQSPPNGAFRVEELADALVQLLAEPQKHHALRVGAWRMAHEFSAEKHLSALLDVLNRAAKS